MVVGLLGSPLPLVGGALQVSAPGLLVTVAFARAKRECCRGVAPPANGVNALAVTNCEGGGAAYILCPCGAIALPSALRELQLVAGSRTPMRSSQSMR